MKHIIFCMVALIFATSCSKLRDDNYPKVKETEKFTITIASERMEAIFYDSCTGIDFVSEELVIKKEGETKWEPFNYSIDGFDYKEGYEYNIKVKEILKYDPRMSVAYWYEYEMIKEISKTKKNTEGLPDTFLK